MTKQTRTTWLKVARYVKDNHQFAYVDDKTGQEVPEGEGGIVLDAVTANMLLTVYDNLNEANREKFAALPLVKAVYVGWKCV